MCYENDIFRVNIIFPQTILKCCYNTGCYACFIIVSCLYRRLTNYFMCGIVNGNRFCMCSTYVNTHTYFSITHFFTPSLTEHNICDRLHNDTYKPCTWQCHLQMFSCGYFWVAYSPCDPALCHTDWYIHCNRRNDHQCIQIWCWESDSFQDSKCCSSAAEQCKWSTEQSKWRKNCKYNADNQCIIWNNISKKCIKIWHAKLRCFVEHRNHKQESYQRCSVNNTIIEILIQYSACSAKCCQFLTY